MKEQESLYEARALSAIKQFYGWVRGRKDMWRRDLSQWECSSDKDHALGQFCAYVNTVEKMQTLFAGVIDFEPKQESEQNGL